MRVCRVDHNLLIVSCFMFFPHVDWTKWLIWKAFFKALKHLIIIIKVNVKALNTVFFSEIYFDITCINFNLKMKNMAIKEYSYHCDLNKWTDVDPKISYHWHFNSVGDLQWPNISGKKLREAIVVHHLLTYILYKGTSLCKYHHLGPLNNSTTLSALYWFGNWTALIYPTRIHEPILHSSYRPW